MSVSVLGTLAIDSIKTPAGKYDSITGGTAWHFSNSAHFLSQIHIISVVGYDFPKSAFQFFQSKNIDTSGVQIIQNSKSFAWQGYYEDDMSQAFTIDTQLNVLELFKPHIPTHYKNPKLLFLGNIDPDIQSNVLNQTQPHTAILDTMNFWISSKKSKLLSVIQNVQAVIINEQEIQQLTQYHDLFKASQFILELGPQFVIVKKAQNGASLFSKKNYSSFPAFPIQKLVDPTGAGDSFAGALVSFLDHSKTFDFPTLKKAICYANILASFYVQNFGNLGLTHVSMHDISNRYQEFLQFSQLPPHLNLPS